MINISQLDITLPVSRDYLGKILFKINEKLETYFDMDFDSMEEADFAVIALAAYLYNSLIEE